MDLNALVRLQKAFDMTEEPVFIIIKRILDSPPTRRPRQGLPLFLDKCEPMTDFVENFSGRTTAKNNPGLGFRRPWCIPPSPVSLVFKPIKKRISTISHGRYYMISRKNALFGTWERKDTHSSDPCHCSPSKSELYLNLCLWNFLRHQNCVQYPSTDRLWSTKSKYSIILKVQWNQFDYVNFIMYMSGRMSNLTL